MLHFESHHDTPDGKRLFVQVWAPEEKRKAAVLIVHGLAEHSSRYAGLAAVLTRAGYVVYTFDGRGHGRSDLPHPSAYFDHFEDYIQDIDAIFRKMQDDTTEIPCFIYGHSMGGGLTVYYALKHRPRAAGILLSGPALVPGADVSPLLIKMSPVISRLAPKWQVLELDGRLLTRDPEMYARWEADELIHKEKVPARTGGEILRMTQLIRPRMNEFDYPVLIMHGTEDRLTNVAGSKLLYEEAASEDKTLKLYDGLYHELINEVEREQVMQDMIYWLDKRV